MGLRSWLRTRALRAPAEHSSHAEASSQLNGTAQHEAAARELAPGCPADEWELVPAYLPVDTAEHRAAVVIAAAIAAGDRPESSMTLRSVSIANPEYRRVTCIATALEAGALAKSSFTVKNIYRKKPLEGTHAA